MLVLLNPKTISRFIVVRSRLDVCNLAIIFVSKNSYSFDVISLIFNIGLSINEFSREKIELDSRRVF